MAGRGLYEALGVGEDAEAGELRGAYLRACKHTHPDRAGGAGGAPGGGAFLEVQAAWEVLRDPARREEYDRSVARAEVRRRAVEERCTFYDEVDLEDLETVVEGAASAGAGTGTGAGAGAGGGGPVKGAAQVCYVFPCRCGELYRLTAEEVCGLGEMVAVPCASCSLFLRVHLGAPVCVHLDSSGEGT